MFLSLFLVLAAAEGAGAGAISGRVIFRGEPPSLQPLPVAKDREACGETAAAEALIVSKTNQGVRYAVVFLEDAANRAGPAPGEVVLENRGCRFVPHVLAIQTGAELAIVNADPVLHNLRAWLPERRRVFNVVQPTQGQLSRRTIKHSGVITLTCDTHTHMAGYLLAFEHSYFAVTDANGAFRLTGVPPGAYRLSVWHEGWNLERRDPDGRVVYEPPYLLSREVVVPRTGDIRAIFELTPRP